MIDELSNIKLLRYINSKIPPPLRRHYSYYKNTRDLIDSTQKNSTSEVFDFQLSQLNKILKIGWKIEGYKKFWLDNGFSKKEILHLNEAYEIPVISKEIIKQNRAFFNPVDKNYKKTTTGGSTGSPFIIYEPEHQSRIEAAFIHDAWSNFYPEISINTKTTILRGIKINKDWEFDPMRGLILSTFSLKKNSILKFKSLIEKYCTPVLHAYPSSLFLFAKMLKENSINHGFKCICLGSEPLYDYQINLIKEVFKSHIVHWYGQGEKVVFASNKPNDYKFHIYPQYGFTEVLTKSRLKQTLGKKGNIIGTSFWNTSMPLIRYDTQDIGVVSKYPDISESTYSFVLDQISGRSQDFILTNLNSIIPVTALNVTCSRFHEINRVRFHQKEPGAVELNIELLPDITTFDTNLLIEELKTLTKNSITFIPKKVDSISPTKNGKHVYLIQELNIKPYLANE